MPTLQLSRNNYSPLPYNQNVQIMGNTLFLFPVPQDDLKKVKSVLGAQVTGFFHFQRQESFSETYKFALFTSVPFSGSSSNEDITTGILTLGYDPSTSWVTDTAVAENSNNVLASGSLYRQFTPSDYLIQQAFSCDLNANQSDPSAWSQYSLMRLAIYGERELSGDYALNKLVVESLTLAMTIEYEDFQGLRGTYEYSLTPEFVFPAGEQRYYASNHPYFELEPFVFNYDENTEYQFWEEPSVLCAHGASTLELKMFGCRCFAADAYFELLDKQTEEFIGRTIPFTSAGISSYASYYDSMRYDYATNFAVDRIASLPFYNINKFALLEAMKNSHRFFLRLVIPEGITQGLWWSGSQASNYVDLTTNATFGTFNSNPSSTLQLRVNYCAASKSSDINFWPTDASTTDHWFFRASPCFNFPKQEDNELTIWGGYHPLEQVNQENGGLNEGVGAGLENHQTIARAPNAPESNENLIITTSTSCRHGATEPCSTIVYSVSQTTTLRRTNNARDVSTYDDFALSSTLVTTTSKSYKVAYITYKTLPPKKQKGDIITAADWNYLKLCLQHVCQYHGIDKDFFINIANISNAGDGIPLREGIDYRYVLQILGNLEAGDNNPMSNSNRLDFNELPEVLSPKNLLSVDYYNALIDCLTLDFTIKSNS